MKFQSTPYFGLERINILGELLTISRTGYTGELGYEIYINSNKVNELWKLLLQDNRIKPAGLGTRDILRLEVGYSLYGQDIDENTTPIEAGLDFFVDYKKEFIGKEALIKQKQTGIKKIKIALKTFSRRSPRQHYRIFFNGNDIGKVTSGCFSLFYPAESASVISFPNLQKQEQKFL